MAVRCCDDSTVLWDNLTVVNSSAELINITEDLQMMLQHNSSLLFLNNDKPDLTFFVIYVFGILLPLSLFIVTGNLLIVIVVRRTSSSSVFQRATNMFVASLAVADGLVGVSLVPVFYLGIFVESLKTDFYFCLVITSVLMVSCGVSMLHVLCIAVDRFLAVMFPLLYHSLMSPRRTTVLIIVTWSVVGGIGLIPYMGWRKPVRKLGYCYIDQVLPFSYLLTTFILSFATPLFTMMVLYTRIVLAARQHARRIAAVLTTPATYCKALTSKPPINVKPHQSFSSGNDKKAIKTTSIIVIVFALCWLPPYIFNFIMHYRNSNRPSGSDWIRAPLVEAALNTLAFGNSAVNPIIYAYRYKEFRREIKKILCQLCQQVRLNICGEGGRSPRNGRIEVINLEQITVSPASVTIGERENPRCTYP